MKTKMLLSILAFGLLVSAFSQKPTMELTFTAEINGQNVPLNNILIENLTQGGDTILYAPDTVLVLDYVTSIENSETICERAFVLSQNRPNPFKGKTEVNLYLPEKGHVKITVRDILGSELANYENILNRGNHTFSFYSGNHKYYLFTVTGKQTSKTIKMLNTNMNTAYEGKYKIVYNGYEGNMISFKSQKAINNFGFNIGDELKYTVYTDIGETSIIDSPTGNQIYTFLFAGGEPCPGMPTITDIDGNTYNTVQIGDQCWMAENLETTTYQNGTLIPNVESTVYWSNLTAGAYVWYDNDISWKGPYGALYNWYAVDNPNGLCPTGWHVPTNDEWTALTGFIGGTNPPHGNELKSCRQVNSPLGGGCNTTEHPRWAEDFWNGNFGTDDYGFSGLSGGYRVFYGPFSNRDYTGIWWSFTEYSSTNAWFRSMGNESGDVWVYNYNKQNGFSVRCLRD